MIAVSFAKFLSIHHSSLSSLPFTPFPQYTDLKAVQTRFLRNFPVIGLFGPVSK